MTFAAENIFHASPLYLPCHGVVEVALQEKDRRVNDVNSEVV